ncbi:MAG: DNA repair protein RecN [Alphaproteobacteria bacterium 41-28]|nr:MAG: DNA repair protein RecN [Alphaproteobacteria bacterium 41-28]
MLEALSINNIVLIDDLHIDFEKGLCVLTGETGAGKSILLDALGLALGERAEARLLRPGAARAQVTATFSLPLTHSLWRELDDQGIAHEGGEVIFRRLLEADGRSKCFLNDQVVSQALMRRLGQDLVEIHGQFDQLLDAKSHLAALDAYGKIEKGFIQEAFLGYQDAKMALKTFQENLSKSFERQSFLRFAIDEIEKVAPQVGEEAALEADRGLIAHRAKIAEALLVVDQNISTALTGLFQSHKALSRIHDLLPEKINPLVESCDQAIVEGQEVLEGMKILKGEVDGTPHDLETIENRLHGLRSLSRKYQTEDLVACLASFKEEMVALEQGEDHLESLEKAVTAAQKVYLERAHLLSEERKKTAIRLQAAIAAELPPLKLDQAIFRVNFGELREEAWGPFGIDQIEFYIQTNPGMPEGPLSAIASGGELSRLMLALKVVLTQSGAIPTLIFDEIERGTGGAVASAMGERLKALSQHIQILTISHSPQIVSRGTLHLVVFKIIKEEGTTTHVKALTPEERQEEVARMLAGEEITEEARAAAKRLMGAA